MTCSSATSVSPSCFLSSRSSACASWKDYFLFERTVFLPLLIKARYLFSVLHVRFRPHLRSHSVLFCHFCFIIGPRLAFALSFIIIIIIIIYGLKRSRSRLVLWSQEISFCVFESSGLQLLPFHSAFVLSILLLDFVFLSVLSVVSMFFVAT